MRKAGLEDEVTTFDVADSTHSLAENVHVRVWRGGRRQIANTRRLDGLLRACRERPRRRAAEQRDEFATFHSSNSSARASTVSGTVRPSVLAVFRLTTSSNLVGCWTGKSDGFSPHKIRSM